MDQSRSCTFAGRSFGMCLQHCRKCVITVRISPYSCRRASNQSEARQAEGVSEQSEYHNSSCVMSARGWRTDTSELPAFKPCVTVEVKESEVRHVEAEVEKLQEGTAQETSRPQSTISPSGNRTRQRY
ncbi:hypothetical protein AOLI_G00000240 [Acnodon oligacanthus]